MGRIQSLQALRFLAAASVVWAHVIIKLDNRVHAGVMGVDVFFVISGFIITLTAQNRPEGFLKNRLLRVLPMYYALAIPAMIAFGPPITPKILVATLTLWPAWDVWVRPSLAVAWTLSYELLFYAALSLVLMGVRPVWLFAAYAVSWLLALLTGWTVFEFLGSPIITEFLFGVVLALWPVKSRWLGAAALAVAVTVLGWFWVNGPMGLEDVATDPATWTRVIFWGVPAALLVFGVMQFEAWFRGAWAKPIVWLGEASYSIYLFHMFAMIPMLLLRVQSHLLVLTWCVGASALLYQFLERPMQADFRQRFSRPLTAKPVTA